MLEIFQHPKVTITGVNAYPEPMAFCPLEDRHCWTLGKGQTKFAVVAVDYFTKWAEAEVVVTITERRTFYGRILSVDLGSLK